MKQKIWSKTLLATYNCLETISNAIDSIVISQGIGSGRNNLTTMQSAERIINLIQRKKLLINLKVLIEKVIARLDSKVARILVLKFFDKLKPEICMEVLKLTRRTYFRRVNSAINEFGEMLESFGYTDDVLSKMLDKENWIKEYYNTYKQQTKKEYQKEDADEVENIKFNMAKCTVF